MEFLTQGAQRYVWTTHSYMVSLFMDCPPGRHLPCPSPELKALVGEAVRKGTITWHAHPHNAQYEVRSGACVGTARGGVMLQGSPAQQCSCCPYTRPPHHYPLPLLLCLL
jgi:hypothetical protein